MIEVKNAVYLVPTNTDVGYEHKDHNRGEIAHFRTVHNPEF
jgi:hypothetical protein